MSLPSPSAPEAPVNEFNKLLGIYKNIKLPPNQARVYYTMHLNVSRRWHEGFKNMKSDEFRRLASQVLPDIHQTMDVGIAVTFTLVHCGKYKLSSKIKMIFVISSAIAFDPMKFERIFKKIIKKDGVIGERLKAKADGLKVEECTEIEFNHLKSHGANPCGLCVKILKNHRGINVNDRSNLVDMLAFTNVLTGIGFLTTVTLLLL